MLEKNLNLISENNYEIIDKNIFKKETYNYFTRSYDIIFVDPPFLENKIEEIILFIKNNKLLKKNGIGIIHRNKKKVDKFPIYFNIIDQRNYGVSKILFFTINKYFFVSFLLIPQKVDRMDLLRELCQVKLFLNKTK